MVLALRNKKGFTLIEALIAILILSVGLIALLRVAVMSIEMNMVNFLRDEAVRIAEDKMNTMRQTSYSDITVNGSWAAPAPVARNLKGITKTFYVTTKVQKLDDLEAAKLIHVAVGWDYKSGAKLNPTKKQYQHIVTSIITRPPAGS